MSLAKLKMRMVPSMGEVPIWKVIYPETLEVFLDESIEGPSFWLGSGSRLGTSTMYEATLEVPDNLTASLEDGFYLKPTLIPYKEQEFAYTFSEAVLVKNSVEKPIDFLALKEIKRYGILGSTTQTFHVDFSKMESKVLDWSSLSPKQSGDYKDFKEKYLNTEAILTNYHAKASEFHFPESVTTYLSEHAKKLWLDESSSKENNND